MGQQQGDEMATVRAPVWKWEWNLNTIAIILGFCGGLIAWGMTWERMTANQDAHKESLGKLEDRVTQIETTIRQIDNHELRLVSVEKQAAEAATSMRAVESTLNSLAADMRVTREILQRIEAGQREGQIRR